MGASMGMPSSWGCWRGARIENNGLNPRTSVQIRSRHTSSHALQTRAQQVASAIELWEIMLSKISMVNNDLLEAVIVSVAVEKSQLDFLMGTRATIGPVKSR